MAPENPFPKPLHDCYDATLWASENAATFGGDLSRLIVCGESAGGNLAAAVALMARDQKGPALSAQVLLYPLISSTIEDAPYDRSADQFFVTKKAMTFFWNMYISSPEDRKNVYASPERASDLTRLPPALIITAEHDPLHYEAEKYGHQLCKAGVKVIAKCFPGVIHGFIDLPIYDEKQKVGWITEMGKLALKVLP